MSPRDCCANGLVQEALKMVLDNCSLESDHTYPLSAGARNAKRKSRSAKSAWPSGILERRQGLTKKDKKTGTCMR